MVALVQSGGPVARNELLDARTLQAISRYSNASLPEAPTLFLEFYGSPAGPAEQMALAKDVAVQNGGTAFQAASDADTRNRL